MINDEEKENFREGVTILMLPRKITMKQVMTRERKSFFVIRTE
jgi:hypothetical protein